jgi:hypothetical protein
LRRLLSLLAISSALLFTATAHADTVTFGGVSTGIPGAADTLTLNAGTSTVVAGVISQAGTFTLVGSVQAGGFFPFTFQENVTVGGITHLLTFSAEDHVTDVADVLTIFALGPVTFGTATLDFQEVSVFGDNVQDFPLNLTANVTGEIPPIPEPSSLILSATGLLAFAGAARRKFLSA